MRNDQCECGCDGLGYDPLDQALSTKVVPTGPDPKTDDQLTVLDAIEQARIYLTNLKIATTASRSNPRLVKVVHNLTAAEYLIRNDPWGIGDQLLNYANQ